MIKLKELLTEAKKSDVKKMEKMANKIASDMTKLNFMFRKHHMTKTSNPAAYRTLRQWEELQRDAVGKYGMVVSSNELASEIENSIVLFNI